MNQRNSNAKATSNNSVMHGLFLSGTIIDRTKRMIPHDNSTAESVTCTIQDGYNRKNGEPSYTLNVQKMDATRGKHF